MLNHKHKQNVLQKILKINVGVQLVVLILNVDGEVVIQHIKKMYQLLLE